MAAAYWFSSSGPPSTYRAVPSVDEFSFDTAPQGASPQAKDDRDAAPEVEPADGPSAVTMFLQAQVDGRPDVSYSLLDESTRRRFPTVAAWASRAAFALQPLTFQVQGARPGPGGGEDQVDVEVLATHRPALDPFAGLVPARASHFWRAERVGSQWRVGGEPVSVVPHLPAVAGASEEVRSWVGAVARCDASEARRFQALEPLLGPADLAALPCQRRGEWSVAESVPFDQIFEQEVFLAAFGPGTGSWARAVLVRGPGISFHAAVGPLGDTWRVIGVAADRT